jgi:hypothetical protein
MFNAWDNESGLGDYASLVSLAQGAGCPPDQANVAAAIAMAESGGIPTKYNPETAARGGTPAGKGSYGLWQIYLKKHPEFEGQNLYDPMTNARAMYSVSRGCSNRQPWSTYIYGQYRSFLRSQPVTNPVIPSPSPSPIDVGSSGDGGSSLLTPDVIYAAATLSPAVLVGGIALLAWLFLR